MDLEHLNKHQVILLALLASFVTSIATGIVTVSLMNQAPPQVAATVNHIIERTIEQVAAPAQTASPATIKTVVVKNDDLAAQSIAGIQKSIIRIVASSSPDTLIARGLIIDAKGLAITDREALNPGRSYLAILSDGTKAPISVRSAATTSPVAIVDITLASTTTLSPATFADPSKLQLGQSVIRIGGPGRDTVGAGVIASLPGTDEENKDVEASVGSVTPGSVLIDLFGGVIGMTTRASGKRGNEFYSMLPIFKAAADSASASSSAAAPTR